MISVVGLLGQQPATQRPAAVSLLSFFQRIPCSTSINIITSSSSSSNKLIISRQDHCKNGSSSSSRSRSKNNTDNNNGAPPPPSYKRATTHTSSNKRRHCHYHSNSDSSNSNLATILAREKANFLSQSFINNPQQQVYRQVYQEICHASHKNQHHHLHQLPPEPGPTGEYVYRWIKVTPNCTTTNHQADDSSSSGESIQRRVYVRQPSSLSLSSSFSADEAEQVVIVVDDPITTAIHNAMSLSVDETMIAYMTSCGGASPEQQHGIDNDNVTSHDNKNAIMVRAIDTQKELQIPTTNNNSNRVVAVEFGPKIVHDANDETTITTTSHALYWVEADAPDDEHRPSTVYTCNIVLQQVNNNNNDKTTSLSSSSSSSNTSLKCSTPLVVYSAIHDPTIHVHLQRTKGCRYMAIHAQTLDSNEVYLVVPPPPPPEKMRPARHVSSSSSSSSLLLSQLLLVRARQAGCMYHVEVGDQDDVFIVGSSIISSRATTTTTTTATTRRGQDVTAVLETSIEKLPIENDNEPNLATATTTSGGDSSGNRCDGHDYAIVDLDLFHDFYAMYQVSTLDGSPRIQIFSRTIPGQEWIVPLQKQELGPVSVLCPTGNLQYHAKSIRFYVDCPIQPRAVYEYNVVSHRLQQLSSGDSDDDHSNRNKHNKTSDYIQERITVHSRDGTLVPLSLVYRRSEMTESRSISGSIHNDSNNNNNKKPIMVILMGYGAYGKSLDISYNPGLQPLLERGFVLAYAHTRGGGELGSQWHNQGRGHDNKLRGIEDYLACAKAIKTYYSFTGEESPTTEATLFSCSSGQGQQQQQQQRQRRPVRILAKAFSAGGVVVGGAVNRQPQLFDAVIFTNAFLNVYATLMDPALPLTQHEWDEYGNPYQSAAATAAIQSFCPVASIPSTTTEQQERQDGEKNAASWPRFLLIAALNDTQVPFYSNTLVYGKKLREETLANVTIHIEPSGGHALDHNLEHIAAIEASFMIDLATTTTTIHGST